MLPTEETTNPVNQELERVTDRLLKQLDQLKDAVEAQRDIIGVMRNLLWSYAIDLKRRIETVSKPEAARLRDTLRSVNRVINRTTPK